MAKQPKSATNNQWATTAKIDGGTGEQAASKANTNKKNK